MHLVHHVKKNRAIVVGGCRLPRHAPVGIKLRDFVVAYPPSPSTVDYSAAALQVIRDIEGNDQYGDCVEAEDAHYIGIVTGNAGKLYSYTDAQTLADYTAITGFNPNNPSTDQGTDPLQDLNYRVTVGYADGSKDVGYALVDCSYPDEVKYALATFGNLKLWFGIPDSIVSTIPSLTDGFVWDVTAGSANQNNGHCIGSAGYSPTSIQAVGVTEQGILVVTWGFLGVVTWAAAAAWFVPSAGGGAAVRVTQDWINDQSGVSPSGLDLQGLIDAFNTFFGGNVPSPIPVPPGPPQPPVPPGPPADITLSLSEVQDLLATNWPTS